MASIRLLPEFSSWLAALPDKTVRTVIATRIRRLELGLVGDVAAVGEGVSELRIHFGAGWRVYFTRHGSDVVILLAGGSKRTQEADIRRAWKLAAELD